LKEFHFAVYNIVTARTHVRTAADALE